MTTTILRPYPARRRYVPDLNRLLGQCEANYLTLKSLLLYGSAHVSGPCESDDKRRDPESQRDRVLELQIIEEDRYTTTLLVRERVLPLAGETDSSNTETRPGWIEGWRCFWVRLYHDLRLAEVLQWHNRRILKGSYPYPNNAMLQRDEKQRVNEFLAEWLKHCARRQLPVYCESRMLPTGAR